MSAYFRLVFQLGFGMACAILSGFGLGLVIDRYFHLRGAAITIGTLIGVGTGLVYLYIMITHVMEQKIDERAPEKD